MSIETPRVLPAPEIGPPPLPSVPEPERFLLDNGLRVVAIRRPGLPHVAARLIIDAGAVSDPSNGPGIASLTASLLVEGTAEYSALELNERIDRIGATLGARAGHDFAQVDLGCLSETLDASIALLAEVVLRPAFRRREVERVKAEVLDALEARGDEPGNIADDRISLAVYGPHHPYGRLPIGPAESVRRIESPDLAAFHSDRYRPDGAILVIAGDFEVTSVIRLLEKELASWRGSVSRPLYPALPSEPTEVGEAIHIDWDEGEQGEIRFGGTGMPRNSPDWVTGAVANHILGGSTITGRLGANLREEKGWTYGVRSYFGAGVHPGGWSVETAVAAEITEAAIAEIVAELEQISTEGVSEEELARAREALVLSLPRAFETPGRVVARFATLEAFDLPHDYWAEFGRKIEAVDVDGVVQIARTYFDPSRLARVAVRPPESA